MRPPSKPRGRPKRVQTLELPTNTSTLPDLVNAGLAYLPKVIADVLAHKLPSGWMYPGPRQKLLRLVYAHGENAWGILALEIGQYFTDEEMRVTALELKVSGIRNFRRDQGGPLLAALVAEMMINARRIDKYLPGDGYEIEAEITAGSRTSDGIKIDQQYLSSPATGVDRSSDDPEDRDGEGFFDGAQAETWQGTEAAYVQADEPLDPWDFFERFSVRKGTVPVKRQHVRPDGKVLITCPVGHGKRYQQTATYDTDTALMFCALPSCPIGNRGMSLASLAALLGLVAA
jgi:hypothetical protein